MTAELMAVVKGNGYGHGDVAVARAALGAGASWLGVALVEEGLRLRDHGIDAPVLVLSELPPGSEKVALRARLTPTVYTEAGLRAIARANPRPHVRPRVHIKVDTGMHRVGLDPERILSFVQTALQLGMHVEGVWTHLAMAEDPTHPFNVTQVERFEQAVKRLRARGLFPRYVHLANSAATLSGPTLAFDLVRVGLAIYGLSPAPGLTDHHDLIPALSLRSAVSLVRRLPAGEAVSYGQTHRLPRSATIATVPIGYADGYFRSLSNRSHVLLHGRRCPVVGVVTMDHVMVECGEDVQPGDEVVLLGRQAGEEISAAELAERAGTIPYEIVASIGSRVPRIYDG